MKPLPLQHDDHIWLTVFGEAWAIQCIDPNAPWGTLLYLWRGYEPNLEYLTVQLYDDQDWPGYCRDAVAKLRREYPDFDLTV